MNQQRFTRRIFKEFPNTRRAIIKNLIGDDPSLIGSADVEFSDGVVMEDVPFLHGPALAFNGMPVTIGFQRRDPTQRFILNVAGLTGPLTEEVINQPADLIPGWAHYGSQRAGTRDTQQHDETLSLSGATFAYTLQGYKGGAVRAFNGKVYMVSLDSQGSPTRWVIRRAEVDTVLDPVNLGDPAPGPAPITWHPMNLDLEEREGEVFGYMSFSLAGS